MGTIDGRGSIPRADCHDEVGAILVGSTLFTGDRRHAQRLELDPATRLKSLSV